jgi:septum formation protein
MYDMHRLLLASASPRRRALLEQVGYSVVVDVPAVDERRNVAEPPAELAQRLAHAKALAVAERWSDRPGAPVTVVAADTVVWRGDDTLLEKPTDRADALRMLRELSGSAHRVTTAVALVDTPSRQTLASFADDTDVYFWRLDDDEMQGYVETTEPYDKAGGYGIQGLASLFVRRIEGSYTNVVGLPVERVHRVLRTLGRSPAAPWLPGAP